MQGSAWVSGAVYTRYSSGIAGRPTVLVVISRDLPISVGGRELPMAIAARDMALDIKGRATELEVVG